MIDKLESGDDGGVDHANENIRLCKQMSILVRVISPMKKFLNPLFCYVKIWFSLYTNIINFIFGVDSHKWIPQMEFVSILIIK